MNETVVTGVIGFIGTLVTGLASWLYARKKYNTEVDANELENLKKSLEFYQTIVKDNNEKLEIYIKLSEDNRAEVYRLKGIVHRLLNNSCLDNKCIKRIFYTEKQISEILKGVASNTKEDNKNTQQNET